MNILTDPSNEARKIRFDAFLYQRARKNGLFRIVEAKNPITRIIESLSSDDKDELNAAYLASLRMQGIELPPAKNYRLLNSAICWKLEFEFKKKPFTTP
jgi:hypothetical protein